MSKYLKINPSASFPLVNMNMSTVFALPSNQQEIHTNDAVEAVINIADAAYDYMWNKLYEQTRILIAKRMSKYANHRRF